MSRTIHILGFLFLLAVIVLPLNGQNLKPVCAGAKVKYSITGVPNSTYKWTVTGGKIFTTYGKGDSVYVNWGDVPGTYTLSVYETTPLGCNSNTVSSQVKVTSGTSVDLGESVSICEGQTYKFTAGNGSGLYLWQDGSTGSSFTASKAGKYWVKVTDTNGCVSSDTALLAVNPLPTVKIESSDVTISNKRFELCNPPVTLNATGYDATSDLLWSTGETSSSILVSSAPQKVWVHATNSYGCISGDTVRVVVCSAENKLVIPNAITPNGDGQNDTWMIKGIEQFPEVTIEIYDRWGREIFKSDRGYTQPWDGTFHGTPMPMDSYYYIIDVHNGSAAITGNVAVIR